MVITIKDEGGGTVTYFETVAPTSNTDFITGSFFDVSSFSKVFPANWRTNYSSNKEGGYKHYLQRNDGRFPVLLHLTGTSRFSDLQTWKNLAGGTVIFLDHDTDPNLNGNYVITNFGPSRYLEQSRRLELSMVWEEYNN